MAASPNEDHFSKKIDEIPQDLPSEEKLNEILEIRSEQILNQQDVPSCSTNITETTKEESDENVVGSNNGNEVCSEQIDASSIPNNVTESSTPTFFFAFIDPNTSISTSEDFSTQTEFETPRNKRLKPKKSKRQVGGKRKKTQAKNKTKAKKPKRG